MNSMARIIEAVADWADKAMPKNGREVFQLLIALYWIGMIGGVVFLLIANFW